MNYSHATIILIALINFDNSAMFKAMELQGKLQAILLLSQEQKPIRDTRDLDEIVQEAFSYADDEIKFRQNLFIQHQKYKGDGCRLLREELSKQLKASNKKIELYPCSCICQ